MHSIVFQIYTLYVTKDANKMKPTHASLVITAGSFHKNVCCHCCITVVILQYVKSKTYKGCHFRNV